MSAIPWLLERAWRAWPSRAWLPGTLALLGACFAPDYPVGIPCSEAGTCPPAQSCNASTWRCEREGAQPDADGDGVPAGEDCDDGNAEVVPGRGEVPYNGVDDDCDPATPDDDLDRDGHGVAADCDDGDDTIHPGAVERCNQRDDDCNDAIDDAAGGQWFADRDGDGHGDDDAPVQSCTGGEMLVAQGGDCDDDSAGVHPGAEERCDQVDNDCDDAIDGPGAVDAAVWYADTDGDGHGDAAATRADCAQPAGHVSTPGDCDDGNGDAYPGAAEQCDAIDADCDGDPANGVLGDGPACAAADCVAIAAERAQDGTYFVDPDGAGGTAPYAVHCNLSVDGGGWQLIASRSREVGVLFEDAVCLDPATDCSGTIPGPQRRAGAAPDLLFATLDGAVWIRLTGLSPFGGNALLDVITLVRRLDASDSCTPPHYCGSSPDPALAVHSSSDGYVPRFTSLPSQFARLGGLWFGNGGGGNANHVVSLNYSAYCGAGGVDFSDGRNTQLGNVACGQPGALYFRY